MRARKPPSARSATSSAAASPSGRRGQRRLFFAPSAAPRRRRRSADPAPTRRRRSWRPLPRGLDRSHRSRTRPIRSQTPGRHPGRGVLASAAAKRSALAAAVEVPTELPRTELPVASVPLWEPQTATGDVTALTTLPPIRSPTAAPPPGRLAAGMDGAGLTPGVSCPIQPHHDSSRRRPKPPPSKRCLFRRLRSKRTSAPRRARHAP